ncbi:peroxide stress protein YaaA [Paenibacillus sp. MMS20-IR301]|uniref:peroxide stress protein YaaA n=1 Tax=Paenibacillus sp. MMS20-IR301 TaxID=2895946 RepID=UPI0028EA71D7|nr:peroxide stress protein YaaA [Paenibacillus sp. MMS20-IR301]WNS41479.1 peroxide stress protein YaaA [Paenibacillus sp. MMS20-IR301]
MRIIISPAKKMKTDTDFLECRGLPQFTSGSEILLGLLQQLSYEEAKALWKCNDAITALNMERIREMDVTRNLTPALFAYEGIQYQYMAPGVLQMKELEYLQQHLRILSGFYGIVRPFDGVVPYRLEMQAKLSGPGFGSIYEFWNRKLADQLCTESDTLLNLASKEYSKTISPYLGKNTRMISVVFGQEIGGKVVERATLVKMARGEMVRFMAEQQISRVEDIRDFSGFDFKFADELSDERTYVFVQQRGAKHETAE